MDLNKFKSNYQLSGECWVFQGSLNPDGYGNVWFEGKCWKSHRLSYFIHIGEIPKGYCVCHSCDNRACINPNHLWLGTHQENMMDMVKKKRTLYGEQRPNNKIPTSLRPLIVERYKNGMAQAELAKEYSCHPSAIFSAIHHIIPVRNQGFIGEEHPRAILNEEKVREIRKLYSEGSIPSILAKIYEVKVPTIRSIVRRKNWKHVKD